MICWKRIANKLKTVIWKDFEYPLIVRSNYYATIEFYYYLIEPRKLCYRYISNIIFLIEPDISYCIAIKLFDWIREHVFLWMVLLLNSLFLFAKTYPEIRLKAVLDVLKCKIFLVAQICWPTGFLGRQMWSLQF